jgi:hypothetical protein
LFGSGTSKIDRRKIMKAVVITMLAIIGLLFIATGSVKANWKPGDSYGYCKSGQGVKNVKSCKESGGKW